MNRGIRRVAEVWTSFWFRPGSAYDLAAARIVIAVHGLWLLLSRDLPALSGLPRVMWTTPAHSYWRYLAIPGHPGVEYVGQILAIVALLLVALGIRTHVAGFVAAVLLYRLAAFAQPLVSYVRNKIRPI